MHPTWTVPYILIAAYLALDLLIGIGLTLADKKFELVDANRTPAGVVLRCFWMVLIWGTMARGLGLL